MTTTTVPAVDLALMADRLEILELTTSLGLLVDGRDWGRLERLFADPVDVDYTSLNGGDPQSVSPADLVGGWHQALDHLDATQHLIAGQVITLDGDRASCVANVQGTHVLANATGGPIWTVAGRYDIGLMRTPDGWRISALSFTVQWATGNQHVMTVAAAQR
jgi:SnoaL-like domain